MDSKYLWSIIDLLRDELSIASDGITDLNDALKDNALQKKYDYLKLAIVDQNDDIKTLKAKIDDLKEENFQLIDDNNSFHSLFDDCKELQKENDSLKDEAIKWNRKYNKLNANYNNDIDASYELDDKHIKIIKDLEEEIKTLKDSSRYPKEYQKESEEYFDHNPQAKSLHFFIKDDDDCINENIDVDDAICTIYKS